MGQGMALEISKKDNKNQSTSGPALYSTGLEDDAVRAIVTRIQDNGHDDFRSRCWRRADSDSGLISWVEAWKDVDTGLWAVTRFDRLSLAGATPTNTQSAVFSGACFFDALYYCAHFDAASEALGAQDVTKDQSVRIQVAAEVAEVAAACFIPFDDKDLPIPAAQGRLFAPQGMLVDDDAYELAARTKDLPLRPIATGTALERVFGQSKAVQSATLDELALQKAVELDVAAKQRNREYKAQAKKEKEEKKEKMRLMGPFAKAVRVAHEVNDCVLHVGRSGPSGSPELAMIFFMVTGFFTALSAISVIFAPAALGGVYGAYKAKNEIAPATSLKGHLKNLESAVRDLPEGEIKDRLQDFGRKAVIAFALENTTYCYNEAANSGLGTPQNNMKTAIKAIDGLLKKGLISDDEMVAFKEALIEGKLSTRHRFHGELEVKLAEIEQKIEQQMAAPRLPAPLPGPG